MHFSSLQDKDRVGKRRKLDKSSHRAKPARQRLLTPLFEDDLMQIKALMSGALPADEIRIKIGTDALASQTQRSRHSPTSANVSVRQPSTEFGPLSEESMLLGDYEAENPSENVFIKQHGAVQAPSMVAMAGSRALEAEVDEFGLASPKLRQDTTDCFDIYKDRSWSSKHPVREVARQDEARFAMYQQQEDIAGYESDQQSISHGGEPGPQPGTEHTVRPIPRVEEPTFRNVHMFISEDNDMKEDEDADEDDDQAWRDILNIRQHTSSHASMAALRSSSQHKTTSGSSHRPILDQDHEPDDEGLPAWSTPRGVGTQGATIASPIAEHAEQPKSLQSPSVSLAQIVRLAEQPWRGPEQHKAAEDADENALWRDFIIGSQGSESNSSQQHGMALTQNTGEVEDGLEDSLFVTGRTPYSVQQHLGKREADLRSESMVQPGFSEISLKAQAEEQEDRDSIEEEVPAQSVRARPTNIHASSARTLHPKMFKRKATASPPRARGFQFIRRAKAPKTLHSVYDLVDSDGMSLA
ncbi:hypothetical protein LTR08_002890 [Meristemomyces frigidus]|nr:hypothetical protein LTR08_002890 [Meristemomyces frigidus]